MTRDRALLAAAALCLGALAAALALFWVGWLAWARLPPNPYGVRAHGFALLVAGLCVLHASATRGIGYAAAFMAGTWAVGLAGELLGLMTGQVFGRYRYTDAVPGKILGLVPAVVPVVWSALSYLAWRTTAACRPPGTPGRIALATVLFVAYDLVADPNHLYRGGWAYEGGGAYYGVPFHNFAGWVVLGLLSFSVIARLEPARPVDPRSSDRLPLLAYATVMTHEALFALAFTGARLPASLAIAVVVGTLACTARRERAGASLSGPSSTAR